MPEDTVHTDADKILDFVNKKGGMSVPDIAKELNLSSETVESLAELLEEENMLQIKYKFTTPYLLPPAPVEGETVKVTADDEFIIEKQNAAGIEIGEKVNLNSKAKITKEAPSKIIETGLPLAPGPNEKSAKRVADIDAEMNTISNINFDAQIDKLIELANRYIREGDFESARHAYLRIRQIKNELPQKVREQERKVNKGIAEVNENIVEGMDKALSTNFAAKVEKIDTLLQTGYAKIKDGKITTMQDLKDTERSYHKIKEVYITLPDGFVDKKMDIQDKILAFYKIILLSKKNLLSSEFDNISQEMIIKIQKLAGYIKEKRLTDANSMFNEITELYKRIPDGFTKEKTELQSKILENYQKLILNRENVYSSEFKIKSDEVKELLRDAYILSQRDKIKKALKKYEEAAGIYASLPEGFFQTRAEIEEEMLKVHHLLLLKKNKDALANMKVKSNEIESLITTAASYLQAKDFDLAKETYLEIVSVYNALPEGFIDLNLKIKKKITELYKGLLLSLTESNGHLMEPDTAQKYNELLNILVQIHENIKNKEFDKIKNKYLYSYRLYHELPLGFIENKMDIYKEIYKVYEELKLYMEISKLAEYAESKEYIKLKESIDIAMQDVDRMIDKYPEDIEFFKYIEVRLKTFLTVLHEKYSGETQDMTAKGIMEKIEKIAMTGTAKIKSQVEENTPQRLKYSDEQYSDSSDLETGTDEYLKKTYHMDI